MYKLVAVLFMVFIAIDARNLNEQDVEEVQKIIQESMKEHEGSSESIGDDIKHIPKGSGNGNSGDYNGNVLINIMKSFKDDFQSSEEETTRWYPKRTTSYPTWPTGTTWAQTGAPPTTIPPTSWNPETTAWYETTYAAPETTVDEYYSTLSPCENGCYAHDSNGNLYWRYP